jgi:NTE family protein
MAKKIAYVLGGGGARGIAHIGVLKVLEKEGIKPDLIIGVSMGSIVGAAYALGMSAKKIEDFVLSIKNPQLALLFKAGKPHKYLVNVDKGFEFLNKNLFNEKSFEDLRIPFYTVLTNLNTGEEKLMNKGNLIEVIKASSCVPGIFPPVKIGSDYYIDGGVANPTPSGIAKSLGADAIIAVDFTINKTRFENPNIISTLMQTYEIIRTNAVRSKMADSNDHTVLLEPKMRGAVDSFMFHKAKNFIKSGEDEAREKMSKIKELLK